MARKDHLITIQEDSRLNKKFSIRNNVIAFQAAQPTIAQQINGVGATSKTPDEVKDTKFPVLNPIDEIGKNISAALNIDLSLENSPFHCLELSDVGDTITDLAIDFINLVKNKAERFILDITKDPGNVSTPTITFTPTVVNLPAGFPATDPRYLLEIVARETPTETRFEVVNRLSDAGINFPILYPIINHGSPGATLSIDLSLTTAHVHLITLTTNLTITFTNPPTSSDAVIFEIQFTQDATGGFTVSYTNTMNTTPTIDSDPNDVTVATYETLDGGITYFGFDTTGAAAVGDNLGDHIATQDINFSTFDGINIDRLRFVVNSGALSSPGDPSIFLDATGDMQFNVPTGDVFLYSIQNALALTIGPTLLTYKTDGVTSPLIQTFEDQAVPIATNTIGGYQFVGNRTGPTQTIYAEILAFSEVVTASFAGALAFNVALAGGSPSNFIILNDGNNGKINAKVDLNMGNFDILALGPETINSETDIVGVDSALDRLLIWDQSLNVIRKVSPGSLPGSEIFTWTANHDADGYDFLIDIDGDTFWKGERNGLADDWIQLLMGGNSPPTAKIAFNISNRVGNEWVRIGMNLEPANSATETLGSLNQNWNAAYINNYISMDNNTPAAAETGEGRLFWVQSTLSFHQKDDANLDTDLKTGGGANLNLSNLAIPTSINQDLLADGGGRSIGSTVSGEEFVTTHTNSLIFPQTGAAAAGQYRISRLTTPARLNYNVPTGVVHRWTINDVEEMELNNVALLMTSVNLDMENNNITDIQQLQVTGATGDIIVGLISDAGTAFTINAEVASDTLDLGATDSGGTTRNVIQITASTAGSAHLVDFVKNATGGFTLLDNIGIVRFASDTSQGTITGVGAGMTMNMATGGQLDIDIVGSTKMTIDTNTIQFFDNVDFGAVDQLNNISIQFLTANTSISDTAPGLQYDVDSTEAHAFRINNVEEYKFDAAAMTFADANNMIFGTTTGTEIATTTSQKIGFYGTTPVVQQTLASDNITNLLTALRAVGIIG